jgi:hypothetical protein
MQRCVRLKRVLRISLAVIAIGMIGLSDQLHPVASVPDDHGSDPVTFATATAPATIA